MFKLINLFITFVKIQKDAEGGGDMERAAQVLLW